MFIFPSARYNDNLFRNTENKTIKILNLSDYCVICVMI